MTEYVYPMFYNKIDDSSISLGLCILTRHCILHPELANNDGWFKCPKISSENALLGLADKILTSDKYSNLMSIKQDGTKLYYKINFTKLDELLGI